MCSASVLTPCSFTTEAFSDATAAVARLDEIYDRNTRFLRDHFEAYINGERLTTRVRATYPLVRVTTSTHARLDSRLSYGFVAGPGVHETSVTQPGLFRAYLTDQIRLLIENHGVPVEIGESRVPIPALAEMQVALEQAVGEVAGLAGFELKRVMRTGTVASVDN